MRVTDEHDPKYRVNQPVMIPGREVVYHVSAVYRLENLFVYELSGLPDFYVRERRLQSADLDTAA